MIAGCWSETIFGFPSINHSEDFTDGGLLRELLIEGFANRYCLRALVAAENGIDFIAMRWAHGH